MAEQQDLTSSDWFTKIKAFFTNIQDKLIRLRESILSDIENFLALFKK